MRIVYLAAGAANMFCGSCLHDNTLAKALLALGHEVLLTPTYTPLRTDEENVSQSHLFFGGINVYLQQKSAVFRHTPWVLDALLDNPALLRWATRGGPSVAAENLGELTISILAGEQGKQRKELAKLTHWLKTEAKPDVVHLSNSMLSGMAPAMKQLGLPVVCTLSGEDLFLEKLPPPYYQTARDLLRKQVAAVDRFVALNRYYADFMSNYLDVPRDKITVIPHGLDLTGYLPRMAEAPGAMPTIGYLARICPDKGLHLLMAACELLQQDSTVPPIQLKVAGYLGELDRPYFHDLQRQSRAWAEPTKFQFVGEVDRPGKLAFLQSLDLFCLPTVYRESKGISAIEALAAGVPVVLPAHGAFPELVADTAGGVLHQPDDAAALAAEIKGLLLDRKRSAELGREGQRAIFARYTAEQMAKQTAALYAELRYKQVR